MSSSNEFMRWPTTGVAQNPRSRSHPRSASAEGRPSRRLQSETRSTLRSSEVECVAPAGSQSPRFLPSDPRNRPKLLRPPIRRQGPRPSPPHPLSQRRGGTASKWPVEADAPAAGMDAPSKSLAGECAPTPAWKTLRVFHSRLDAGFEVQTGARAHSSHRPFSQGYISNGATIAPPVTFLDGLTRRALACPLLVDPPSDAE